MTRSNMPRHLWSCRRAWLVTGGCMAGGLVAGYGTLAVMAARFLYAEGQESIGVTDEVEPRVPIGPNQDGSEYQVYSFLHDLHSEP